MNAPEWIKYTGSDRQIKEIKSSSHGVMFEYVGNLGIDTSVFKYAKDKYHIDNRLENKAIAKYLICQPHPYADLIKIWADTGCPVWVKRPIAVLRIGEPIVFKTTNPYWNIPGAEYRITPFED